MLAHQISGSANLDSKSRKPSAVPKPSRPKSRDQTHLGTFRDCIRSKMTQARLEVHSFGTVSFRLQPCLMLGSSHQVFLLRR